MLLVVGLGVLCEDCFELEKGHKLVALYVRERPFDLGDLSQR